MNTRNLVAAILAATLLSATPTSALAYGSPSVAKAERETTRKVEKKYRKVIREYEGEVFTECKLKKTLKGERRYRCNWYVSLGFDGGYDDVDSPSGDSWTYWYKNKPWYVILF